jgi:cyanobactin biosynthesis protein (PatB/AcyB/McaB family)
MRLPLLSPPIQRPHFIQPGLCVDLENGRPEDLVHIRMDLLHAANYNDPAAFANRSFNQVMHSSASQSSASQGWGGFGSMAGFY